MLGPLTYLDVALLFIAVFSGFLAMYRGLTRELLSILSWLAAAATAIYAVLNYPDLSAELAEKFFQSETLAKVVLGAGVFLFVLLVVHFLTAQISDRILDSRVGMVDRILGFMFGMVRGFLIVVIAYLFFDFLVEQETQPKWIVESQSLPYIKSTGKTIESVLLEVMPASLAGGSGAGTETSQ